MIVSPHSSRPTDQAKVWRAPGLPHSELLHAHYIQQQFAPHMHDQLAIGVVEAGAYTYRYRGADHVAGRGDIVCCNPGEVHTGHTIVEDGWRYRMFYLDLAVLRALVSEIADREWDTPYFAETVIHDPAAAQLRALHLAMERGETRLEQDTGALTALAALVARHADDRPVLRPLGDEREPVARAKAYIEAHSAENLTLDAVAAVACMSQFHLVRVFHEIVGLPPHAYLIQLRVMQARQLLAVGESVTDAAVAVGFFDQSHLTRHFRRIVGVTPGRYRQMVGDTSVS